MQAQLLLQLRAMTAKDPDPGASPLAAAALQQLQNLSAAAAGAAAAPQGAHSRLVAEALRGALRDAPQGWRPPNMQPEWVSGWAPGGGG